MFTFNLFGKTYEAATLADASAKFSALRDKSGRGASSMPTPILFRDGELFGYFSYNGRVWNTSPRDWSPESVMLFPAAA